MMRTGNSGGINNMSDLILYIEDNDNNARIIELILKRAGYSVLIAKDGKEGIQQINDYNPVLVICDFHLPGVLKGFDVAKIIRETPHIADTPFLMLTADSSSTTYPKSMEYGADAYLNKPVTPDQLIENVANLLRIR